VASVSLEEITRFLKERTGYDSFDDAGWLEAGRVIESYFRQRITKADPPTGTDRVLTPFTSFSQEGTGMLQLISQLHTSRLSAFGFVAEAESMDVTEYQVSEQLDSRGCPVCEVMHGRKFKVSDASNALNTIIRAKNPDDLKALQPWPKQHAAAVEKLKGMNERQLVDQNWHIPPYHPWCRGLLVPVGRAPKLKPIVEQEKEVVVIPTSEEVMASFQELNVNATPELSQSWVQTVGQSPMVFFANVLAKKLSDLTTLMLDVGRESKLRAAGITRFDWNKREINIAGKRLMENDDVMWSLSLDFYDRKWKLRRMLNDHPELRREMMEHWSQYFDELGLDLLE
jgi:hypothetical protein